MKKILILLLFCGFWANAQQYHDKGAKFEFATNEGDTITVNTRIPIIDEFGLINYYVDVADLLALSPGPSSSTLQEVTENGSTTTIDVTLANTRINGSIDVINTPAAIVGVENVANFAGQTDYGNEPIGSVLHHYTNGIVRQIDNVGENNDILVLKNARNPSRRLDKPSDFFGTGNFLKLLRQETDSPSDVLLFINKDANFVFGNATNPEFITDKDNTGYGFLFSSYKDLTYPIGLKKQGQVFFEIVDASNRTTLRTTTQRPNGMDIGTQDGDLRLMAQGVPHLFVKENGNVGVGVSDPLNKLSVNGTMSTGGIVVNSDNTHIILRESDNLFKQFSLDVNNGVFGIVETEIGNRLTIDGNNTTITGTVNSNGMVSSGANSQISIVETDSGNKNYLLQVNNQEFRITETGVAERLVINGGNTSISGNLSVTGTITATGDVIANSDKRLKKNIKRIDNALAIVQLLGGYEYDRKDMDLHQAGVIAQEVEEVFPVAVSEDANGTKSVAYNQLIALLIEAVKEQQIEIEQLKTLINEK